MLFSSTYCFAIAKVTEEYKAEESSRLVGPFLKELSRNWSIDVLERFIEPEMFDKNLYVKMLSKVKDAGMLQGCESLNVGSPRGFSEDEANVALGGTCNFEFRELAVVVIMQIQNNSTKVLAILIGKPLNT